MMLKQCNELKAGKCIVVYELNGIQKETEGSYNDKFRLVFMCIPESAKVIGYIQ